MHKSLIEILHSRIFYLSIVYYNGIVFNRIRNILFYTALMFDSQLLRVALFAQRLCS